MAGRQAKLVSARVLRGALMVARRSRNPKRDVVMLLLSVRAGLRACEIARLEWEMVVDAQGRVSTSLDVEDRISKYGSGRRLPMHPELKRALENLASKSKRHGLVVRSERGGAMRATSIVNWFREIYGEVGAKGCSSHSGRRTFITEAARRAPFAGASIRDVQALAGHRSIEVTQSYIEGDTNAQRRLVRGLGQGRRI